MPVSRQGDLKVLTRWKMLVYQTISNKLSKSGELSLVNSWGAIVQNQSIFALFIS